jgi:hypothetical protein
LLTLRLTQTTPGPKRYRVEIALEGEALPCPIAIADFEFIVKPQDREDLRWYLKRAALSAGGRGRITVSFKSTLRNSFERNRHNDSAKVSGMFPQQCQEAID